MYPVKDSERVDMTRRDSTGEFERIAGSITRLGRPLLSSIFPRHGVLSAEPALDPTFRSVLI
jgi:hypothetical protein